MPILDLQRRLVEVGRVRMGATVPTQGGGRRPTRLENWRLTSRDPQRLNEAAQVYGGDVKPWEDHPSEHVLDTTVDVLPIMLLPGQTLTQAWEMWSGGGCKRRCDGEREQITDGPCLCPATYDERSELAKDGKACKPVSRLSVLLPEIAGIGCWRLETHGYYAAVELAGTAQLLEEATRRGAMLPARLRIDQRTQLKNGKTTHFPVPVIDIDVRIPEMLALGAAETPAVALLEAAPGYTPLPPKLGVSVSDGIAAVAAPVVEAKPRANAAAPIGPSASEFDDSAIPVLDDEPSLVGDTEAGTDGNPPPPPEPAEATPPPSPPRGVAGGAYASAAQVKLLWTTIRTTNVPEGEVRRILREVTGQESSRAIPFDKFEAVYNAVLDAGESESQFPIPDSAR